MQSENLNFEGLPNDLDIYMVGDLHAGEKFFARDAFERFWKNRITRNPQARVIGMGDWISDILPRDPRFAVDMPDIFLPDHEAARSYFTRRLRRNAKKFLYFHFGNHEWTVMEQIGNFVKAMCDEAGVRYAGIYALATLKFDNGKRLEFCTHHGWKLFRSVMDYPDDNWASVEKQMRRFLLPLSDNADLYACGHTHLLHIVSPKRDTRPRFVKDEGKIRARYPKYGKWLVNTGSFYYAYLEGETSYAERRGLPPLAIGCPKIEIRDGEIKDVEEVLV